MKIPTTNSQGDTYLRQPCPTIKSQGWSHWGGCSFLQPYPQSSRDSSPAKVRASSDRDAVDVDQNTYLCSAQRQHTSQAEQKSGPLPEADFLELSSPEEDIKISPELSIPEGSETVLCCQQEPWSWSLVQAERQNVNSSTRARRVTEWYM